MTPFRTDLPLAAELAAAVTAVRQAAALCREVQAAIDPGALAKSDRSPVTVADFGSQALVCRILGQAFPDDPVIGEEDAAALRDPAHAALRDRVVGLVATQTGDADAARVLTWIDRGDAKEASPRFWTLDPIDGTKGFLRGGQYAIALALILDGEIALAALGCPNLGAHLDGPRGDGTLLCVGVASATAETCNGIDDDCDGPIDESLPQLEIDASTFCIIVTRGHSHDEEALAALAPTPARYVGMIGSKRKIRLIFDDLRAEGLSDETLSRVHAPLGLDIGSQTVPEIAVSIVAELIAIRNRGGPQEQSLSSKNVAIRAEI